jgi:hypothetical protein
MAAAERELAELDTPPPLAPAQIDALVARAVATTRPRERSRPLLQRRLAAAGLLLLLAGAAAWARVTLWPSGQYSVYTLDYATAIALVDAPNEDDARLLSAIGILDEHCAEVFSVLHRLVLDEPTTQLATTAQALRTEFRDLLDHGTTRGPTLVGPTWTSAFADTTDSNQPIGLRHAALEQLAHLTREGLVAILSARLQDAEMQRRRQRFVTALRAELE